MTLNPDTLLPSGEDELLERQTRTGEIGNGLTVLCQPDPENPQVVEQRSRAVCFFRPYAACVSCPHRHFELFFEVPEQEQVMCPRWEGPQLEPDCYVSAPLSDCRARPFPFCGRCPSREELALFDTDKNKAGWLSRYWKLSKEER